MTAPQSLEESTDRGGVRGFLATMPRWKKVAVYGATGMFVLSLISLGVEAGMDPAAPHAAPAAGDPLGSSLLPGQEPAAGEPANTGSPPPAWSAAFFRFGFSFFVGFAVGYAVRTFLKFALVLLGGLAVSLFLLSYVGFVHVDWEAMDGAFERFVASVRQQAGAFRVFITGSLPNAGLAATGIYAGFRKNR